jgi:hypothetical protein
MYLTAPSGLAVSLDAVEPGYIVCGIKTVETMHPAVGDLVMAEQGHARPMVDFHFDRVL